MVDISTLGYSHSIDVSFPYTTLSDNGNEYGNVSTVYITTFYIISFILINLFTMFQLQ